MTTVSVALASYNGGRYVREQLESVLRQSRLPDEIVVADDGSSDDTVAIVREVAGGHPNVTLKLITQGPRLGITGNFERALRATTGDLIALSDQDDRWHDGRLAAIIAEFDADPELVLLHHDADLVGANGESLGRTLFSDLRLSRQDRKLIRDDRAFAAYVRRNLATGATVMFRRTLLDVSLPFPEKWVHDEWLAIMGAALGRVRVLDEALIDYRLHGANQIGVTKPTLRHRVKRMLAPRGSRYIDFATRSTTLVERLGSFAAAPEWRALAEDKAAFEAARALYPLRRLARIPAVLRQRRSYGTLSSQGNLDIARDIIQSV